jgi:HEAT repeat protein
MKCKQRILCIFALALCEIAHADYNLALMGENAVPFLLRVLTDKNHEARRHAANSLRGYADSRALPGLTAAFLNDSDEHVRSLSAWALASADVKYTVELMVSQLDKENDPVAQNIAVSVLSAVGDTRVIPTLVQRLDYPDTKKDAAFKLARFRDKRAVPVLTEMLRIANREVWADYPWEDRDAAERAMNALVQIGDERSISILIKMLDSPLKEEAARVLPDFGAPIAPPLLEMLKQTTSREIRDSVAYVLERIHEPQADRLNLSAWASTFGKIYLETEDWSLRRAMAKALANMGTPGIEYLLKGARRENFYSQALQLLSTYNSKTVADAVAELALDVSNPFRLRAIQTLQILWPIWSADLMPSALKLLRDSEPLVRLYTISMFRELEIREATEALRETTSDSDERVRRAASSVLALFSGITPLKLEIEMNRTRYRYGEPVTMKYGISNIVADAAAVCTFTLFRTDMVAELILKPEIRKPDGTLLKYRGPVASLAPPRKKDYRTLQPGDVLSGYIDISKFYRPYQPGRYTAKLSYRSFSDGVQYGLWGWVGVLTSQEICFEIAPPSAQRLDAMIADIDIKKITRFKKAWVKAPDICYRLGEIRNPAAIKALQALALYKPTASVKRQDKYLHLADSIRAAALKALASFPLSELTPMWIELLDDGSVQEIVIDALTKIGNPRAIEPLRHLIFSGSDNPIKVALALKELGDDKGVEWLRKSALRKLKHWDQKQRQDAVRILSLIHKSDGIRIALADKHPEVRAAAAGYWLKTVAEDIGVAELESMLTDPNTNVQKAVAYQLASLGNEAGLHLIQQDLNANDVKTRRAARRAFLTAGGIRRKQ